MILRLWAIYSRSKLVLGSLLMLYIVELILFLINYVITDTRSPSGTLIYLHGMHNNMTDPLIL